MICTTMIAHDVMVQRNSGAKSGSAYITIISPAGNKEAQRKRL